MFPTIADDLLATAAFVQVYISKGVQLDYTLLLTDLFERKHFSL